MSADLPESNDYWNAVCIPLSKGKHTIIDSDDYDRIRDLHIHFQPRGGQQNIGYAIISNLGKRVTLHGFLFSVSPGMEPDHKNRDRLDNRKNNLRPATTAQNNWNKSRGRKIRRSKYKGIWLDKRRNTWHVKITANGVSRTMGYFKKEEDAAQAYNFLAHELHGEFAFFNRAMPMPEPTK